MASGGEVYAFHSSAKQDFHSGALTCPPQEASVTIPKGKTPHRRLDIMFSDL